MLHSLVIALAVTCALSLVGATWTAFWRSGVGIRTIGGLQRLNRRVFGPPKPQPVELGPDGRWRPFVDPRERRSERIAAWIIGLAFVAMAIGVPLAQLLTSRGH